MASVSDETAWGCTLGDPDMEEIDLPDLDGALLTALLEDSQAEQPVDERLAYILRSLETEIGQGITATASRSTSDGESMDGDPEDSLFDGMISDAHSCSASMLAEDPFGWVDVDVIPSSSSDEMSDWCLSSDEMGLMDYEDSPGYPPYSFYCEEVVPVEEGYGPLWQ